MAGPYSYPPLPDLRCSGMEVVPKKDGGWRVIYHLSAPPGESINDFIDPASFSLNYCTIDAAIAILNTLGQGALMGKIDLKNAFRLIPVRKEDWNLLGIHWHAARSVVCRQMPSLWLTLVPSPFQPAHGGNRVDPKT